MVYLHVLMKIWPRVPIQKFTMFVSTFVVRKSADYWRENIYKCCQLHKWHCPSADSLKFPFDFSRNFLKFDGSLTTHWAYMGIVFSHFDNSYL